MREIDKYLENWIKTYDPDYTMWIKCRGKYGSNNFRMCSIKHVHSSDGSDFYQLSAHSPEFKVESKISHKMFTVNQISKILLLLELW